MIDPVTGFLVGKGLKFIGGLFGRRKARRKARAAEARELERRKEMERLKDAYSNISTTNPFLNMQNQFVGARNVYADAENVMEDLTVNQQQAQFESQQFAQSQANILSSLRESAGGSGIASLAQSLAQQGRLRAQQASASIGKQEAANQRLAAQEASRLQVRELAEGSRIQDMQLREKARIQDMERRGELLSRQQQRDQTGTLLGMAQGETAAARQERMGYEKQRQQYETGLFDTLGSTFSEFGGIG